MSLDINWLAVLASAVATFVLGGLWYGPLFGRIWRAAEGQTEPPAKEEKHPAFVYGLSFVLMLVAASVLAVALEPDPTLPRSVGVGLAIGIGWVATAFGVNYLFAGRRFALFAVDAGYNVVLFALMGLIIGLFG
ncbi:MAG TPA: DUF1761 domain-containing protein [Dongiaceae bacterium]|jgi:hypothetical protein